MQWKAWHAQFDKGQLKEIEFACLYAEKFNHGTDGHNSKLIVAKFAKMLDGLEDSLDEGLTAEKFSNIINKGE